MSQNPFPQEATPSRNRRSTSWKSLTAPLLPRRRPWCASSSHKTTARTNITATATTDEIDEPIELSSPRSRSRHTLFFDIHGSHRSRSVPNPSSLPSSRNISALWPTEDDDPPAYLLSALESPIDLPPEQAATFSCRYKDVIPPHLPVLPSRPPLSRNTFDRPEAISHGPRCRPLPTSSYTSADSIWHEISHEDVPRRSSTFLMTCQSFSRSLSLSTCPSRSFSIISAPNPNTSWESLLIPSPTHSDGQQPPLPTPPPPPPSSTPLSPSHVSPQPSSSPALPSSSSLHLHPSLLQLPHTPRLQPILDDSRTSISTLGPATPSEGGAEDGAEDRGEDEAGGGEEGSPLQELGSQEVVHWTVCGGFWFREGFGPGDGEGGRTRGGSGGGFGFGSESGHADGNGRVETGLGARVPWALGCCGGGGGGGGGVMDTTADMDLGLQRDFIGHSGRRERPRYLRHGEGTAATAAEGVGEGGWNSGGDEKEDGNGDGDGGRDGYEADCEASLSGESTDEEWHRASREVVSHHFDAESGRYVRCKA